LEYKTITQQEKTLEWWGMQSSEYPEMAELAMFLLDCPVQAATCERVFKEFARLHTKRRANLINRTTFQMTQVKHAIRKEFKKEDQALPGNKVMNQREHERIDVPLSPVRRTGNDEDEAIKSAEEVDLAVDSADEDDEELLEGETDVVEYWKAAIDAGGGEADIEEEEDDNKLEGDPEDAAVRLGNEDVEESYLCYEEQLEDEDLQKWPEQIEGEEDNAYKNWPQENKKYFAKKKRENKGYVRADKFSLSIMCEVFTTKVEVGRRKQLPTMKSAYEVEDK
jgi:hypothetical protein